MQHPERPGYQPDQHPKTEPNSDTSPHQAAAPLRERRHGRQDRERSGHAEAELTPAEQDEKEKIRAEAAEALASVYDRLRSQPNPGQAEITAAIRQTPPLTDLSRLYARQLETVISKEHLAGKTQEEFVSRSMEVLDLWIHLQGLKRGTNRDLESLRAGLGQM